jgi:chemotaxis response regulator CheB
LRFSSEKKALHYSNLNNRIREQTGYHAGDRTKGSPKCRWVQDTDEKPAAGFPIVGIGASAGGLAVFEVEDGMTVQLG